MLEDGKDPPAEPTPEQQLLDRHGGDINVTVASAWKELSAEERDVYQQKSAALKAAKPQACATAGAGTAAASDAAAENADDGVDLGAAADEGYEGGIVAQASDGATDAAADAAAATMQRSTGGGEHGTHAEAPGLTPQPPGDSAASAPAYTLAGITIGAKRAEGPPAGVDLMLPPPDGT